jgi:dipeptidyl aminopeptidase/acylaminoacyl peptidase
MLSSKRSKLAVRLPSAFTGLALALVLAITLPLAGCGLLPGNTQEGETIPPVSAAPTTDLGLGPGTRALSFGPGDKSAPRVSPSGERVAFVLDGYMAEKSLYVQNFRHRTGSDFGAEHAEWLTDEGLAILGQQGEVGAQDTKATSTPNSLFSVQPDGSSSDDSPNVSKIIERVTATGAVPGGGAIAAVTILPEAPEGPTWSRLLLLGGSEEPAKVYLKGVRGSVTGLSVSPDGREAIMAVRRDTADAEGRFEIQTYQFSEGLVSRVARFPSGVEILGAPQWTQGGIHFVAGEVAEPAADDKNPAIYTLYQVPTGSDAPERVRGVGEDFIAASISVSPDGSRLAVVGRRNSSSPTNLYVLDLSSESLEAATTNENMEVKTNPLDLTWTPDGRSVILIARGTLSGPKVYDVPAQSLSSAFYNLYEVPVTDLPVEGEPEG